MVNRVYPIVVAAIGGCILLTGCATPGPMHVYSVAEPAASVVRDSSDGPAAEVPSFLERDDILTGFAYDPFTDHFFLRLKPGNKIRVVDRPARDIKREFTIDDLRTGGDLAIRPRDGHVFFLETTPLRIVETTRLGKKVHEFELESVVAAKGIALDPAANKLAILHADGRRISFHTVEGKQLNAITLAREVAGSLALDAERSELHAPAASDGRLLVFDLKGQLLRESSQHGQFVDVGARSFVRVF